MPSAEAIARILLTMPLTEAAERLRLLERRAAERTLGAWTRLLRTTGPLAAAEREHHDAISLFLQVISARYDHVVEQPGASESFAVAEHVRQGLQRCVDARVQAIRTGSPPTIEAKPKPRPGWW